MPIHDLVEVIRDVVQGVPLVIVGEDDCYSLRQTIEQSIFSLTLNFQESLHVDEHEII